MEFDKEKLRKKIFKSIIFSLNLFIKIIKKVYYLTQSIYKQQKITNYNIHRFKINTKKSYYLQYYVGRCKISTNYLFTSNFNATISNFNWLKINSSWECSDIT